jgi:NADP-reducing hydrogenase subunit HndA
MKKGTTTVTFKGTPEQEEKLNALIAELKGEKGATMRVLQGAQEIYGYLPIEVQHMIAVGLEVPVAEVYGISTFYSQFALNPKGEVAISVCLGTACYVKGSGDIYNKIKEILNLGDSTTSPDGKYSLEATRCVGACGLAPVVCVNEDVYGRLGVGDIKDIIAKY